MMRRIPVWTAPVALLLLLAGCGNIGALTTRYRAEQALWRAQQEEARLRLAGAHPDSASLERLRAQFAKLKGRFSIPPEAKPGTRAEQVRVDIIRILGNAELTGARLAMIARQPKDALERARWVARAAERDTFLAREADLRIVDALQALGRYGEAVDSMWMMVDRFPPVPPRTPDEQDPILRMPSLVTALHLQLGDTTAARQDRRRAVEYYQRLLADRPPPLLEAQVRTLTVDAQLALGDRDGALETLNAFEQLVDSTPSLKDREPEVLFAKASVRAMFGGDPKDAVTVFDEVINRYPDSPYAARALVESGVALERADQRRAALARYRQALEKYPEDETAGPIALFRGAMLKDRMGDWAGAKQDLESIPLRFPESRGALEAPFAIVAHYRRSGELGAARASLLRAVDTYRTLLARDSTAAGNAAIRWNIARCYAALDRPKDALSVIDDMSRKDRRSPLTAVALRQGAELAAKTGDPARARAYLERFLLYFPQAPDADRVRLQLDRMSRGGG
jgi:tetratricopeptide (TPR) repeat protein